jgi:hypothetical protein
MDWRCRPSFLMWLFTPILICSVVILLLLHLNPQRSRYIYIFQSMVTFHENSNPWGDSGPRPPNNYTGAWYRWHWNGRLSFEEHYESGELAGPFRAWDRSGHQWIETAYRVGHLHGDYILFYENGMTNVIKHFFDEEPTGLWIRFDRDGQKSEQRSYSSPGVKNGEVLVWDTNGVVIFRQTWRKGEPWNGSFEVYRGTNWFKERYESGTLISSTNLGPYLP